MGFNFLDAYGQELQGGVDFTALAFFGDDAKDFEDVFGAIEMIATVAQHVHDTDDAPALKFAEAGADVGTSDGEGDGNLIGGQRVRRDEEQGVDLGDGAVDAPAGAHFAPMEDEFLGGGGKRRALCVFSHFCINRKYSSDRTMSSRKLTRR